MSTQSGRAECDSLLPKSGTNWPSDGRFWEPAGYWVGIAQYGKKSRIEEVFCGFACYTYEEVLLDALSNQITRAILMREMEASDR